MKRHHLLTIASLVSILLMTFHMTDDAVHVQSAKSLSATSPAEMSQAEFLISGLILGVWLYGTLALSGRRSGYVIMLLGSMLASLIGVFHTLDGVVPSSRGFAFVWILLCLEVTGVCCFILSIVGLWALRGNRDKKGSEGVEVEV